MVFDPTKPAANTDGVSKEMRDNFNSLAQHHAGATEPSDKSQGFVWLDTADEDNVKLKQYNGTGWVTLFEHVESTPVAPGDGGATGSTGDIGDTGAAGGTGATGSGTGAAGWVYVYDITVPGGSESDRVWQDAGDNVLQSLTVSAVAVEVEIRAAYPLVTVNGVEKTLSLAASTGFYSGTIAVTLAGSGDLVVAVKDTAGDAGAQSTVDVTVSAPPTITAVEFQGGYPGSQTELKENDTFDIAVTADKDFDRVRVLAYEACQLEEFAVAAGTSAVVTPSIADQGTSAVLRPARVQVRDADTGAWGPTKDTDEAGSVEGTNVVKCNNLYPSVSIGTITYPATQSALKGSESATVANTLSDFNTVLYDDPTASELSITDPTTSETPKTVTRDGGTYNVSTPNFRIAATRAANDATTTEQTTVYIAAVAPTITVVAPAARLRSGGNNGTSVQNHVITISSNQLLLTADMDEDTGGGTFIGSWAGSPPDASWTRTLQVADDDVKGSYDWQNLSVTNLAGIPQTVISVGGSYVLGGFVARSLTFAAFATTTQMGVEVKDFSKLTAGTFTATGAAALKQAIGTSPPVTNGYTIQALDANPTTVVWLDTTAAATNSSGTAQITDVEETV